MATTMINGVIHHDGKVLGIDVLAAALRPGPASLAFSYDEFNADTALALYPHQINMLRDIESGPNLQLEFYNWLYSKMQEESIERVQQLAGRFQPFTFSAPLLYHGDMLHNESDRRIVFMRPSNVGKTEASLNTYAARIMRRGHYGKLAPTPEQMQREGEAVAMAARMFKAMTREAPVVNRTMHRVVRYVCANWSDLA